MSKVSKLLKNPTEAATEAEVHHVQMATIFYEGKPLSISFHETHMPRAIVKLLKLMDSLIGNATVNGFPKPWREIDTVSAVGEYSAKDVVNLVANYNKVAKIYSQTWAGSYNSENLKEWSGIHCAAMVADEITMVAYEMGVPRPTALNRHYQLWSAETYGETQLLQMASILNEMEIGLKDVFVDLGCGVGQIVAFVSAYSQCKKTVGIELSPLPWSCSEKLTFHFRKLMRFFGKRYGKFELHNGNILDTKFRPLLLEEATVIFINNLLFPEELMLTIKDQILQHLKDGTRIITTKPLYSVKNQRVNLRRIDDLVAMSDSIKLESIPDGVSWTNTPVQFYKTTIRRGKLQEYYDSQKKEQEQAEEKKARKRAHSLQKQQEAALNTSSASSSSSTSSNNSSPNPHILDDSTVAAPAGEEFEFAVPTLKKSKNRGRSWSAKEEESEAVFKVPEAPEAPEDQWVFKAPEDFMVASEEAPEVVQDEPIFKVPALPADLATSGPLVLAEDPQVQVEDQEEEDAVQKPPLLRICTIRDAELLQKHSIASRPALMELHKREKDSEGVQKENEEIQEPEGIVDE